MNSSSAHLRQRISGRIYLLAAAVILLTAGIYLWGFLVERYPGSAALIGQASMKVNTTAGFLVAGLLLACARIRPPLLQGIIRWLLAIPLFLLGALTLFQYVSGVDLRLDQMLAAAPRYEALTSSPGRMSPVSASGFMMFALAIMIDHWQTGVARGWSRTFATILTLVALTSLLGYAYGAPALYLGTGETTAMSLLASILFLVLGIGTIWIRAEYGLPAMLAEQSVVGTHIRALIPMVVGAPILVGAAVAAGYSRHYEGPFGIALTVLGSVVAAGLVAVVSIILLRRAESELYIKDRALAATTNGVIITDHRHPNEPIVFVNAAFSEITGYAEDETIGRNCRFLNRGAENPADVLAELRDCIRNPCRATFELQNMRSDGNKFWNRLSIAPIEDYEGKVTHFVGVMVDISDRRAQETRLSDALDEARTANDMRNTFVRLVSHELRTPLNAALTWIRLLEVDDSPGIRDKGLKVVAQSIDSQSRLIDDLVDVTRFTAAGVRLQLDDVDVAEILRTTTEELRPSIEVDHDFIVEIDDGDYSGRMDPLRIQQVLRNLVTNANKYTPAGGRIQVRLTADDAKIHFYVVDNGKGLTQDHIDNIFEPFWRADSHQPGLGVGLSIVAALVSAHSGTIVAHSDGPGQGSTFKVRLPRQASAAEIAVTHDADALSMTGTHAAAVDQS